MKQITIKSLLEIIKERGLKEKLKDRSFLIRLSVNFIVFFTLIFLLMLPALGNRGDLVSRLAKIRSRIRTAQINIANMPRLRKSERRYQREIKEMKGVSWSDSEIVDLIGVLSEMARNSNVVITGSEPEEYPVDLPEDFNDFYDVKLVRLDCEADYHSIGTFLNSLESYEKLIKIVRFVITPIEGIDKERLEISLAVFSRTKGGN